MGSVAAQTYLTPREHLAAASYFYPDIVVVCGEPRAEDNAFETLLNSTVIMEVLSPSTEAYDRGEKFGHYQQITSLSKLPP